MSSLPGARGITAAGALLIVAAAPAAHADIALSLYGDIDGGIQTTGTRAGATDGFSAAKLEFFTSANAGRWSFLAETLFEAGEDNEFGVDVERIQIGYLVRDWLRIAIGRFHTAIGYYNDGFHHGAFFMLPVARPQVVEFEDEGGLIPAHSVGVHADGRFALGDGHVRYGIPTKALLGKIKQEVFKGEMTKPVKAASDDDVVQAVAASPGTIGVVSAAAASHLPRSVIVIAIGG